MDTFCHGEDILALDSIKYEAITDRIKLMPKLMDCAKTLLLDYKVSEPLCVRCLYRNKKIILS